jgi:capsid protein
MRLFSAMSAARAAFTKAISPAPQAKQAARVVNHTYNSPHASYGSGIRTTATYMPMRELREARPMDRREAIKSSRFLRNRLGLVKALFENSARHAVGSGISPTTDSGDKEYDKRSDDFFENLAGHRTFDVREEHTVYTMQPMLLADMMCDGDLGAAKVRDENNNPRVQLFPTEAIGDAPGNPDQGWREGILRDLTGRKLRFRVLKETRPGDFGARRFFDYSASEFMHVARFDRININRPMPWLSHGKESCLDILDSTSLEKATRKLNSYIAAAITTPTGETPVGFEDTLLQEQETQLPSEAKDGTSSQKKTTRVYADFLGGAAIPVLADGEKFEFFANSRTSLSTTEFIDWLITDIATGFGVAKEFVWSVLGMSGPNARLILQQTDWFFKHLQEILIATFLQPVWEGVIEDALNRGKLKLPKPGANWRNVQWQGPQSMSIDKGRDGQLFETLVKSGMLSRSEWHEMSGKAGRRQRFKIMDEIAEDIAYCDSKKIPLELYFGTHPGQLLTVPGGKSKSNATDPEAIAEAVVNLMAAQKLGR